ncbi:MAG: hypothetical protein HC769_35530 [Cyanobacteria bacterium CRU_2_1]|nr:hypothetical protein [Cyanobacteria bacterium CRU_2_1]
MNKILNSASHVFSNFKNAWLGRIFIVVLAGFLMFSSTACSPNSPNVSGTGSYRERVGQSEGLREYTDRADGRKRPGMDSYNEYGEYGSGHSRGLDANTKALVDRAEQNNRKAIRSPEDYARNYREGAPLDARVRNLTEDAKDSAQQFKEDVAKGTEENLRNLRSNVDKAGRNIQEITRDASEFAQDRVKDTADSVRSRT